MECRISWILLACLSVGLVTGCADADATNTEISPLRIAGATFPAPLYDDWTTRYQQAHAGSVNTYKPVGSSEGIRLFLAGEVDIGASDAALTDEQMAKVARGALLIPATAGSVAIVYNTQQLPPGLRFSRMVYVDLFLGKITTWDDPRIAALNPGVKLPKLPVMLVMRSDGSGTTFAFTNHLNSISVDWRNGPGVGRKIHWPKSGQAVPGNDRVVREVANWPGALGYAELGSAERARLGIATLENHAGNYVAPSPTTGVGALRTAQLPENLRLFFTDPVEADAYPIVTFTWLLVYEKYDTPERASRTREFVRWCLTEGQQYSDRFGMLPLPDHVAAASLKQLDRIKP